MDDMPNKTSGNSKLPPEKPTIKAEKGWYASGDSLRAQCSSPPADPPANLTWLLNGRDITVNTKKAYY
ncbi:unnamed protein product [Arctia plantaginis]|uniref:Ig-like domain-containing protein n=1 Tax=Arctia plantaginis TaxID=874455 RepID=A0A8S1AGH0_ARCPL|nr:unnamed protein product [Arctia plantaginis]